MKSIFAVLLLGASATESNIIQEDAVSQIRFHISDQGMEKVGARVKRLEEVEADMYENDQSYKNMLAALEKLRASEPVGRLKAQAGQFIASEDGKKLGQKYRKFAVDFRTSIKKDANGDIVIDNQDIEKVSDDFKDLTDYMHKL